MYSVMIFCPDEGDATSFYRGMGPLSLLKKMRGDFSVMMNPPHVNWVNLSLVDLVFFQRPSTHYHFEIIRSVKKMGVPLWIDFDDAEFHVPKGSPNFSAFNAPDRLQVMAEIVRAGDVVSVSTPFLKNLLAPLNSNIQVIPNAWNDLLFPMHSTPKNMHPVVCWRGGASHREDLNLVAEGIIELSRKYPQIKWIFLGENPWFTSFMDESTRLHVPQLEIISYFRHLPELKPDVLIVPLVDNTFNRAKSNIAWLEATLAGAVSLGPTWSEEWQRPGMTTYADSASFEVKLEELISTKSNSSNLHSQSVRHIQENLRLSQVNQLRSKIMDTYFNRKFY